MNSTQITKQMADFHLVEGLYLSAFPPEEREPLSLLLSRAKRGRARFEAHYDNGEFVGLSSVATVGGLAYVQYLAVVADKQSKGYGGRILAHIKETHPQLRIFLNMEILDGQAANAEQREKRRAFYIRNGYSPIGLSMTIAGNTLEPMATNGTCTADELRKFFKSYFGFILYIFLRVRVWES